MKHNKLKQDNDTVQNTVAAPRRLHKQSLGVWHTNDTTYKISILQETSNLEMDRYTSMYNY